MQKKQTVKILTALMLIFTFLISLPFSVSAEELSASDALAALKADLEDPYTLDTVESAYLYCLSTETELLSFDSSGDKGKIPADTVKLLTALTAFDLISDLGQTVTVSRDIYNRFINLPSRYGYTIGDTVTYGDLLRTMLLRCANDSAVILSLSLCSSTSAFTEEMNKKAASLGLTDSKFTNPTGIYSDEMRVSAKDIFKIAQEFYKNSTLMSYVDSRYRRLDSGSLCFNQNFLLSEYYNGTSRDYRDSSVNGMIAGYSNEGGHVLVRSATYKGYDYICVILGAQRDNHYIYSYTVSGELIKWGANNFSFVELLNSNYPLASIPVKNARETDSVPLIPTSNLSRYLLADSYSAGRIRIETKFEEDTLTAPIAKGTEVGTIYIYYEDELIAESTLKTACDITENTTSSLILSVWKAVSSKTAVKIYIAAVSLFVIYVLINSIIRYQKKNKHRSAA